MNEKELQALKERLTLQSWALMRLELMEAYNPEELEELAAAGTLEQSLQETQEELSDERSELLRQGHYSMPEISEILRNRLLEQYVYLQTEEAVQTEYERQMAEVEKTVEEALARKRASRN